MGIVSRPLADLGRSEPIAGDVPAPKPPRPTLRIYARDNDTRVRFIADGTPVPDAERLVDAAFFDTAEEANAHAAACAATLNSKPIISADLKGWHPLPPGADINTFVSNLLRIARQKVQGANEPFRVPVPAEPVDAHLERARLPAPAGAGVRTRSSRTWPREKDYALVECIMRGMSAKATAADPRIDMTEAAVYKRASRIGYSFAEASQIAFGLPLSNLIVIDRAAAAAHKTRAAFVREWMMRATANPARYGLIVV